MNATAPAPTTGRGADAGRLRAALAATARWWLWDGPLARVAWLRAVLYLFTVWDVFVLTHDVIGHGYSPELYQPTLLGRVLPFPDPTPTTAVVMQWTLVATCLATPVLTALPQRVGQWAGRVTGWVAGIVFLAWMVNSQGFAYVSHDHMALVIALLILPTVPPARFGTDERAEAAGWVLRCVQVCVVMTYFGSALCKIVATGGLFAWPNGTVFTWALMRRGPHWLDWALQYPALLRAGQWILFVVELASPAVLWLRGRRLYAAALLFGCFHLLTWLALGIHFLPTVVCWLAFLPLERIVPAVRRRRGHGSGGADAEAVPDDTVPADTVPAETASADLGAEVR